MLLKLRVKTSFCNAFWLQKELRFSFVFKCIELVMLFGNIFEGETGGRVSQAEVEASFCEEI
jgi:hypothetical protein